MAKIRLDQLLVNQGLFPSREKARSSIMAGQVQVAGQRVDKPGTMVAGVAAVTVTGGLPFVSRGGLKLDKALDRFPIVVADRIALDVGASTGGFTDCLLQRGCRHVYAIDVGYGQLAWSLRQDERVTVIERTNVRHLAPEVLYADGRVRASLAVIDTSFISLRLVLPAVLGLLAAPQEIVALIKPQFEAGREDVGKGVIRDPQIHARVIRDVLAAAETFGLGLQGIDFSPLRGPEGNIEFLAYWRAGAESIPLDVAALVATAVATAGKEPVKAEPVEPEPTP
ncbi:MAG: TlyA family RNA methyltransferase [Candidatus Sericytochromatia bacterium]|nr:TlyA family RNA methyltransferase [Candidatus Sericytochromatia bacterium]